MVSTLMSHRIPDVSFDTFECQKVRLLQLELSNTILIACEQNCYALLLVKNLT